MTQTIVLKGGVLMPLEVIELVLDLEARGYAIRVDAGTVLVTPPQGRPERLSASEQEQLTRLKPRIKRLVHYCELEEWRRVTRAEAQQMAQ